MNRNRIKTNRSVMQTVLYGIITGVVCGGVLALFLICARVVLHFTFGLYESRDGALAVVCLLMLVVLCCLITAVIQTLCPQAKGSGIPLAQGSARGMLRVKWLSTAASLIAGSILAFLSGLPLGSEGPSVGVGGLIGEGVGATAKKPVEFRRYLITGGASAGLAVAFNAPLTGICFAFEETHRRFSPNILAAALSCVISAVATAQAIFFGFGHFSYLAALGIKAGTSPLSFLGQAPFLSVSDFFTACGIAALCGAVCAGIGIAYNRVIAVMSKLFSKIHNAALRLLPVFVLSAACGLALYLNVGSGEATLEHVSINTALWLLFTVLLVRFALTTAASGAAATGGLFLPMIAIGGLIGTIAAKLCVMCGLDARYAPNVIMTCICAFFSASVRAPITATLLSVELTASFANLLPCVIAVSAATLIAHLSGTAPLYERMLESIRSGAPISKAAAGLTVRGVIPQSSPIAGKCVSDVMWPYNTLVTELVRDGKELVPDGETLLLAGDEITLRAENVDTDMFYDQISEYVISDAIPNVNVPRSKDGVTLTAKNISQ